MQEFFYRGLKNILDAEIKKKKRGATRSYLLNIVALYDHHQNVAVLYYKVSPGLSFHKYAFYPA